MSAKVYEIITSKILEALDKGCVPWRKPWKTSGGFIGGDGTGFVPKNHATGKAYRGINVWLLNNAAMAGGYRFNRWLSWKQVGDMGGNVKRDESKNYTVVVFWKPLKVEETDPITGKKEKKMIPLLRYYRVYNVDQCEGLKKMPEIVKPEKPEETREEQEFAAIECAEAIITGWKDAPPMHYNGGNRAFYRPLADTIHMPERKAFNTASGFYETMFHEMGHATGHKKRLNRSGITREGAFDNHAYGKEELVAEMTSAFLCGICGLEMETVDNMAAYIKHWKEAIAGDNRMVVMAAAQAQKAADYIQNIKAEEEKADETDGQKEAASA